MKKHVIIPLGICLLLIVLSGFFLHGKYVMQVEAKKELMVWYVSDTKTKLEVIASRVKEIPYIVMPVIGEDGMLDQDIIELHAGNILQLERFYIENSYYIKGISVFDMYGDVFNLYRDKTGEFIQDTYKSRAINTLRSETGIAIENNSFSIVLPVYRDDMLAGNVAVNLDIVPLHQELFKLYLENSDVWPTSVLDEETALTLPLDGEWVLSNAKDICREIQEQKSGFVTGRIKGSESPSVRVVTYYESLAVPEHCLGIAFSSNISPLIVSSFLAFAVALVILVALAIAAAYILNHIIIQNRNTVDDKDRRYNLLQTIYGYAPIAFIVNRNGHFYTANNYFLKIFDGIAFRDDSGKVNFPFHFQHDYAEWDLCKFEREGKAICLGRRHMSMELDKIKYTIDAFWDVTEMEQRLKDAIHSEITKSELLSRISTDVKKTLGNVRNAGALLLQQFPEEKHIAYINGLTADLSVLIDDVQDYADIEAGRIILDEMPFSLAEEIKKVTETYRDECREKGIEIDVHIALSAVHNVVGDPQRFRQILHELLSNAVKFTDEGAIRISLETTELQGRKILIRCSVEDTGRGMPRQKLKNLFSLDLRAKEGDSIGLGVIITRKLASIMGGTLRAASPSPISTDPSAPGMQFSFSIICFSDQPCDKCLDYSNIVAYRQVNILIITSDTHQMQYLANFLNRKGIHTDVFIYDKDSSDLLINKLIIDKSRYQVVVIATTTSEMTFTIADEINQKDLTGRCLYALVDTSSQKGNYIKAKLLNMDYYFIKSNDLSIYDSILKTHFPNLSDEETPVIELVRKDLRILIAENNALSQTVARVIFKKLGYEVDLAQNALYLINQLNHKAYDVIFIDLKFPPTDGFEIAEMLRMKGYKMPIIAMTSTLTKENIKHIADSGMDGHLPKPLNPESIKHILVKWFV
ncbi:MAG: response regulator [Bacteroidales bacterium]|jgi:signal transduction histidine kinase|nr:response regulator [Bacteroidales bacterium]